MMPPSVLDFSTGMTLSEHHLSSQHSHITVVPSINMDQHHQHLQHQPTHQPQPLPTLIAISSSNTSTSGPLLSRCSSSQRILVANSNHDNQTITTTTSTANSITGTTASVVPGGGSKKFVCCQCGAEFNRNWNLCRHQTSIHHQNSHNGTLVSPGKRKRHRHSPAKSNHSPIQQMARLAPQPLAISIAPAIQPQPSPTPVSQQQQLQLTHHHQMQTQQQVFPLSVANPSNLGSNSLASFQAVVSGAGGGQLTDCSSLPTIMLADPEHLANGALTVSITTSMNNLINSPGIITLSACPHPPSSTSNNSAATILECMQLQPPPIELPPPPTELVPDPAALINGGEPHKTEQDLLDDVNGLVNPILGPQHTCEQCGLQFNRVWNLQRHQQLVHSTARSQPGRLIASKICPVCRAMRCRQYKQLIDHVRREHRVAANIEQAEFASESDFLEWKHGMETQSGTSFAQKCGSNEVKDSVNTYFACNRTGFYQSKNSRNNNSGGGGAGGEGGKEEAGLKQECVWGWSVRMGATCTAFIRTAQNKHTGKIKATYCLTHLGH